MSGRKNVELDNSPILDESAFLSENKRMQDLGRSTKNALTANKTLNVPHYYQDGESWSDNIMQTAGLTIGEAGCGVTSFAMIAKYKRDYYDPGTMNTWLGNYACPFNRSKAAKKMGYTVLNYLYKPSTSTAITTIKGCIEANRPVMVYLVKGSNLTHFVVAKGYSGSNILINDPESDWDYDYLNTYLDNGWSVQWMCSYRTGDAR